MRIIKLAEKEFKSMKDVFNYFEGNNNSLLTRNPKGKFRLTKGRIGAEKFFPGEKLAFTYQGYVCYKAISDTGVLENLDDKKQNYPNYFIIDIESIRRLKKFDSVQFIDDHLRNYRNVGKNVAKSRGWVIIEDNESTDEFWDEL